MKNLKKLNKSVLAAILVTLTITNTSVTWANNKDVDTSRNDIKLEYNDKYNNKEKSTYIKNYVSKSEDANKVINIPDANLKQAIYEALNKNINDSITKSELESIESLYAWDSEITNLQGLENCINLESLYLENNKISDIKPLLSLDKITNLDISYNNITDISQIKSLSCLNKLVSIGLSGCNIENLNDIIPMLNPEKLSSLQLSDNNIINITELSKLTNLEALYLEGNNISDISAISNLTNLWD